MYLLKISYDNIYLPRAGLAFACDRVGLDLLAFDYCLLDLSPGADVLQLQSDVEVVIIHRSRHSCTRKISWWAACMQPNPSLPESPDPPRGDHGSPCTLQLNAP